MSKAALTELSAQIKQLQTDFAALTPPAKPGSGAKGPDDAPTDFAAQFSALQKDFEAFKLAHAAPAEAPESSKEFKDLGTKVTELALKLDEALKEQGGTDTGDHQGGDTDQFSAV